MSIRKILVPVDGTLASRPVLETAFAVARHLACHVECLHVRPDPREAVPLLGEGISGAMIEDLIALAERESANRAAVARAMFDEVQSVRGIPVTGEPSMAGPSTGWVEMVGREDDAVVMRGRLADLVVVGRPKPEAETSSGQILRAALFESGRPVMLCPDVQPAATATRVAIAWNASAEAARTVFFALPLLCKAESVTVYTVGTDETPAEAAGELVTYLAWHGVAARLGSVASGSGPVGGRVLEACAEAGIDLLVMGAYTHSRLRELILGGVTHHVLSRATVPLFMAH